LEPPPRGHAPGSLSTPPGATSYSPGARPGAPLSHHSAPQAAPTVAPRPPQLFPRQPETRGCVAGHLPEEQQQQQDTFAGQACPAGISNPSPHAHTSCGAFPVWWASSDVAPPKLRYILDARYGLKPISRSKQRGDDLRTASQWHQIWLRGSRAKARNHRGKDLRHQS